MGFQGKYNFEISGNVVADLLKMYIHIDSSLTRNKASKITFLNKHNNIRENIIIRWSLLLLQFNDI